MEYLETRESKISGVRIVKEAEPIFYALISIDIHTASKNQDREALEDMYADMLLCGCGRYTRLAFQNELNMLGASITATIANDVLTFGLQCLSVHKNKLFALFALMLQKPVFSAAEIKRVGLVISNELEDEKEDAKLRAVQAFSNAIYGESDRRHSSSADALAKALKTVSKKRLQDFHADVLGKKWIYTIVTDTQSGIKLLSALSKLRESFPDTVTKIIGPEALKITACALKTLEIKSKQNIELAIGAPLPLTLDDPEYHAFVFGLNVLGKWGGFAGRLMSTVREKEGLTYGIYAQSESAARTVQGHWRIMTFFAPDKIIQGIRSTLFQVRNIAQKGITKDEYIRFMAIIETQETLIQDSILRNASLIHSFLLRGFSYDEISVFKRMRRSVTQKEVNAALKKYLDPSKIIISAAGPVASCTKELKALLSAQQ